MKNIFCVILFLSLPMSAAPPTEYKMLTLTNGKKYESVTIREIELDGIRIMHAGGMAKIPYEKLTEETQKELGGFDPEKAKKTRAERKIAEAKNLAAIDKSITKQRASANATIGKTREQCAKKYGGKTASSDKAAISYTKAGIGIIIAFLHDKAARVQYMKPLINDLGMTSNFTQNEIDAISTANASGGPWESTSKHLTYSTYKSGDGLLTLLHDKRKDTITISTVEYNTLENAADKARVKGL